MWKGKMTQEEDDLEEELSSLDIREDHGAEDSDVTPINTPPTTPPVLYIKKYPPVIPPQIDGNQNFRKFSRTEDYDCRSESSLSWGDDEFEGEATKQVSMLFDQVDVLLYKEKDPTSVFAPADAVSNVALESPFYNESLCDSNKNMQNVSSVNTSPTSNDFEDNSSDTRSMAYKYSVEKGYSEDIQSPEKIFNYGRYVDSSPKYGVETVVSDPSPELHEECNSWVQQFPHFRLRGLSLKPGALKESEECLFEDQSLQEDYIEDIVVSDGDFHHLLPLVVYTSANQIKNNSKESLKQVTSSSRVCSGSNDPEVLKEQVFIALFEKLWETVTKTVEPLLYQYARYIIEQSVQYLSISREPSTRGSRIGSHRISQKVDEDTKMNNKFLLPSQFVSRPFSGMSNLPYSNNRPISSIRRPSSAVYKLQNNLTKPDIHREELQELLQVSTKPLQNIEDRLRSHASPTPQTRESSAVSRVSQVSFPVVTTPRDLIQRPASTKSTSRHLTPMKSNGYTLSGEQRPASTSSFNIRMRFQEKYQNLYRQCAIQELGTDIAGSEAEDGIHEQPSPVWSRHLPFLPPISDTTVAPLKSQLSPTVMKDDKTQPVFCVKGTVISSSHRSDARTKSGIPIIESEVVTKPTFEDKK